MKMLRYGSWLERAGFNNGFRRFGVWSFLFLLLLGSVAAFVGIRNLIQEDGVLGVGIAFTAIWLYLHFMAYFVYVAPWIRGRPSSNAEGLCFVCLKHTNRGYKFPSWGFGDELFQAKGPDDRPKIICAECLAKAIEYEDALKVNAVKELGDSDRTQLHLQLLFKSPVFRDNKGMITDICLPSKDIPWIKRSREALAAEKRLKAERTRLWDERSLPIMRSRARWKKRWPKPQITKPLGKFLLAPVVAIVWFFMVVFVYGFMNKGTLPTGGGMDIVLGIILVGAALFGLLLYINMGIKESRAFQKEVAHEALVKAILEKKLTQMVEQDGSIAAFEALRVRDKWQAWPSEHEEFSLSGSGDWCWTVTAKGDHPVCWKVWRKGERVQRDHREPFPPY